MSTEIKNYAIAVKHPNRERFMLLGSKGQLVHLRIYALQFTEADAKSGAEQIERDNPGYLAKAKRLWK